jgi:hypothetical protein
MLFQPVAGVTLIHRYLPMFTIALMAKSKHPNNTRNGNKNTARFLPHIYQDSHKKLVGKTSSFSGSRLLLLSDTSAAARK